MDYGLAKKYRDPKTKVHIPFRDQKKLTGTARYTSLNTHLGIEQSRRDDLVGLAYVLIYFLRGNLPWQGVKAQNKHEKYEKIMEGKMKIPVAAMIKGYPSNQSLTILYIDEFGKFLHYGRTLKFEEKPDYSKCRRIFRELATKLECFKDNIFDWTQYHVNI